VDGFAEKFGESGLAPGCLQNCFAMAENTFAMTSTREGPIRSCPSIRSSSGRNTESARCRRRPIASTGVPLGNVQIQVRSDSGAALPDDNVGEIWIRSDCMLDSYHNNWEETQRSMLDVVVQDGRPRVLSRRRALRHRPQQGDADHRRREHLPAGHRGDLNEKDYLIPGRNVAFGVENPRRERSGS